MGDCERIRLLYVARGFYVELITTKGFKYYVGCAERV